jgi:hypothetical protein
MEVVKASRGEELREGVGGLIVMVGVPRGRLYRMRLLVMVLR